METLMNRLTLFALFALTACAGDKSTGDDTADAGSPDADGDGFTADADCNDADKAINPSAQEVCGGVDEDCDGLIDEADDTLDSSVLVTSYVDADGDTFGDPATAASTCDLPAGTVTNDDDCDDSNAAANPGGVEVCDEAGADEDCDGQINEADDSLSDGTTAYIDSDGDSHGAEAVVVCAMGPGLSDSNTDCDDSNPAVNPDSIEMCDADDLDEDCDGAADDLDTAVSGTLTFYTDLDGDNWGGEATGDRCDARSGEVAVSGDCDDNDAALNGDDADGDAYSTCEGDCDDTDISLYPDTCGYTYAAGLFAVGGVCEFSMEGPATSSFPACPDCDYGFDTVATDISGGCISTFDAVMANDEDTNSLSFDPTFYGTNYGEIGPFTSSITAGTGYDILDWGTGGYFGSYYGTLFLYR